MAGQKENFELSEWYEELVKAVIVSKLKIDPSKIQSDVTLSGRVFEGEKPATHQIDVLYYEENELTKMMVIVSCKNQADAVKVKEVRDWATVMEEVKAQKGVIVARSGFQEGADSLARTHRIALVTFAPSQEALSVAKADRPTMFGEFSALLGQNRDLGRMKVLTKSAPFFPGSARAGGRAIGYSTKMVQPSETKVLPPPSERKVQNTWETKSFGPKHD